MKVKGGPNKACAACKFQRRRCSTECSLAPFFPADQPKIFHNVHRLFGVSKVIKILRKTRNDQKLDAMKSIIYESNVRERFPVLGCFGIISTLHQQLQQATEELHYVQAQLALFRENSNNININNNNNNNNNNNSPSSQIINSYEFVSENDGGFYSDQSGETTKSFFNLNNYSDVMSDPHNKEAQLEIQPEFGDSQAFVQGEALDQDNYDYMNFYAIDDESNKEACESSSESSSSKNTPRQQIQLVSKNELRSAAACFSLMSLN